jgi:hypothetical protein
VEHLAADQDALRFHARTAITCRDLILAGNGAFPFFMIGSSESWEH